MNIHHLELFYFVARFGGISEAVRNMPYGIQQPAVSMQVLQLEQFLGKKLFERRPFALTPEGEQLFKFIEPFFNNLKRMAEQVSGQSDYHLRIGASALILRHHLPEILRRTRKIFPELRLTLQELYQPMAEPALQAKEIDIAVTLLEDKIAPGLKSEALGTLSLQLVLPPKHKARSLEDLLQPNKWLEPLICLPPSEAICKHFQDGLRTRGVDWLPSIELSSLEMIDTYVSHGFGVGLSVSAPGSTARTKNKVLPLPGFAPVKIGVLWRGNLNKVQDAFLQEIRLKARELFGSKS